MSVGTDALQDALSRPTRRASASAKQETAPVPKEHGAWVILYAPALIALASAHSTAVVPAALLVIAITCAFLARNVAGSLLRGRGKPGATRWLILYAAAFVVAGAALVWPYRRTELLFVGGVVAALFAVHSGLAAVPSRRRLDRSAMGEILAVAALCMSGPAALVAVGGHLGLGSWWLWAACTLYFSGGVLFVKMLLAAAKLRKFGAHLPMAQRLRVGRDCLVYHAALSCAVPLIVMRLSPMAAALAALAYVPALVRAVATWATLSPELPPLRRIGYLESAYAIWFTGLLIAAARMAA